MSAPGPPLGQARRQERVTSPKPLLERTGLRRGTPADVAVTVDDHAGTPWLRTGRHEIPLFGLGGNPGPDGLPLGQARRQGRVTPPKPLPERTGLRPRDSADVAVTVHDHAGTPWLRTGRHETLFLVPSNSPS